MPHTSKSSTQDLPADIVAQMQHAITCFVNGAGDSSMLMNALKQMDSLGTVPKPADSDVVRTFRTLWRATPRRPTITDGQWEADYRYVLAKCYMPALDTPAPLTFTILPTLGPES